MNIEKEIRSRFLLLLFMFCVSIGVTAQDLYVATNGNDSNDGSINNPLATLIGARDKARSTGAKNIFIRGGRYYFDTTCELGSQDNGVSFSGFQDEKVIFDGSKFINPEQFQIVTEDNLLAKLHNNAKGKVFSRVITDTELQTLLDQPSAQISINDKMGTVARFPNIGFAHMNRSTVTGESIAESGTESAPKGPEFQLRETIDASKWGVELGRLKKMKTRGYISADWLKEDNIVHSVSASGSIKLRNGSRYGTGAGSPAEVSRLFFYHLLCELDEPGEWYYDPTDSRLYIWPIETINNNTSIGVWAGPQCFEINDGQDIEIKKMTIQNIGSGNNGQGAINVKGTSQNILVAGITFRFIAAPLTSVNFWHDVRNSKVQSCDFYDVPNNSRLYGGKITPTSVEYGNNVIENCHFTQVYSKDFYGKACGITGAGNIFRNNLIHNMNGQPVTHTGVDHIIELNEAFNVGIEEGDGGAFYTGNAMWSFGNKIRHNFVHHIMSVPKLLGRASFFSDDLDAGEEVYENVTYKGGWEVLKMNKGGGHSVVRNVVLEGYRGIRNGDASTSFYTTAMNYLSTNPTSNDKSNYIGRMLKEIGVTGWESTVTTDNWSDLINDFWYQRYPKLKSLLETSNNNNSFKPYASNYEDNMFYGNSRNILGGSVETVSGNQDVSLAIFENPSTLNLKFKEPRPSYAPNIPFDNIGLYLDAYRCAVPDKNEYRQKVKQRFDGQPAHDNSVAYDFNTINDRLYYNSGAEIYKSVPCSGAIEETGDDSYTVKATGETCLDKANGQIKIQARDAGSYIANLDGGADINFTSEWLIENLSAGTYELCITNTTSSITQCYGLDVEAGTSVTGKAITDSGKVAVNITEGTAPFDVYVNNEMVFQTSSTSFSVNAGYGDVVEVKTSEACEGVLSKTIDGIVSVSPNPTKGEFAIALSMPLKNVTVSVYNVFSQLVSSKAYPVNNGQVSLDINGAPAGIYFAAIEMGGGKPKVLKIIKK
ncbi:T9SS type A sorting domain-containing protein [Flavivirga algicola]|uniref:T9SS type A sorting domain-containing protein n=1 Tax=Flavivirga algicola TaxID=2729136 RepID=A0ABX1S1U7_9FLAO|nr:T9SS type A sorting domain-containing protein [Flavivirga algicola]NMH89850.1 T9SS type A sorting domain-containing protein [Flavivirga algicola]